MACRWGRVSRHGWVAAALLLVSTGLAAQQSISPELEYKKLLKVDEEIQPLGENPFGENVGLYNGSLSFSQTDISLSGTGPLLQLTRTFRITGKDDTDGYANWRFADWDLDLPRITTLVATQQNVQGWMVDGASPLAICTHIGIPPVVRKPGGITSRQNWGADEWWHGYQLVMPGGDSQDILGRAQGNYVYTPQMSGQVFPALTKKHWMIGCLPQAANDSTREAFFALAPDGTKYTFNLLDSSQAPILSKEIPLSNGETDDLYREYAAMLVTKVEDRFGNWLHYNYSGLTLTSITASDGREISLQYNSNGTVASVTAQPASGAPRTWAYSYGTYPATGQPTLTAVTQPDQSRWGFAMANLKYQPDLTPGILGDCSSPGVVGPISWSGNMTHPSGLTGSFTVAAIKHGRSHAPKSCWAGDGDYETGYALVPRAWYSYTITNKTFTGAGLPASQSWNYNYSPANDSWDNDCVNGCPSTIWTDVVNPDGRTTRYTFSNWFNISEGRMLRTDMYVGNASSALVRSEIDQYANESNGPWPSWFGNSFQGQRINAAVTSQLAPLLQKDIQQDGDTYTWLAESFNDFAQVTKVKRSNSFNQDAVEEQTAYLNDLPHWVLGLPTQVDNIYKGQTETTDRYTYDLSNVTLSQRYRFGQQLMSYTFNAQGQLASFTDGNNHTTTLGSYKRGIPQSIGYPDNTTQSLVVNDFGQIASITDQAGSTTSYSYDAIGRIAGITYPAGDEAAWLPKTFGYAFSGVAEQGVPANHWRRVTTKGDAVTITYFDAMLRPVLNRTFIAGTGMAYTSRTDYDWKGQKTFVSYPVNGTPDLGAITSGVLNSYDALGRLTKTQQASELGTLVTSTAYLSGARKQVTDPKNNITTTAYQVFDQPSYDTVISMLAPEEIGQTITRDVYGNPTVIRQRSTGGSYGADLTKKLYYDAYHRLCRTWEPESGSEVTAYDNANNVAWTASGLSIADNAGCGTESVAAAAQTVRTYDAMNRVKTLAPPAGTQSTTYAYDVLGNVRQADSGITTWTGTRNKLGQLTAEVLSVNGNGSNVIRYAHDAYGSLASISYPDATVVDYAPDALGRPTKAGSYASNVSYHPDGDIAHFVYGNGTDYLVQKNARMLLGNFTYARGSALNLSEDYTYDANGNIGKITDLAGGPRTKSFDYDGSNRLRRAQADGLWGVEEYYYDALNNFRRRVASGQILDYNYDGSNRLATITQAGNPLITLAYDPRGNVTSKNSNTLNFDAKNQLSGVVGFDTYAYDAAGRRVLKTPTNGGSPSYYFYNQGGQLLYQYDAGSYTATDYVYLGKKLIAKNVTDTSILLPSQVNVTLTLVGAPSLSADGQQINATVDISNHGSVTLTSSGPHPVHLGNHTVDRSGNILANDITRANIPDIAPGAHAAVTISTPANQALGTGNLVQYELVQEAVAWFHSWGFQPITVGPFTMCPNGSPPALCNIGSALAPNEANVKLSLVTAPTLSADGQTITTVVDFANQGTITLSSTGPYPVRLGYHVADPSGRFVVMDTTRADIPAIAPGGHLAVSIAMPSNGILGTGNSVQFIPVQDGVAFFDAWGIAPMTISPLVSLSVPSSSSSGSYGVSWGSIAGAASYNLQEQLNGGSWATVQSNASSSWNASGRGAGTYSYRVQACGTSGCGPWSTVQSVNVLLPPPTPTGITVPATSNGPIPVSWNASPTATRYDLYQNINNAGWTLVASTASTSVTVTATTSGGYQFFVAAFNASGWNGAVNNSALVTVTIPPSSAPSISAPGSNNSGSYTVTWSAVGGGTSYNLQEQVNGGGWTQVQANGSTSWGASGKGTATYGYRVQACNAGGCGPWSGTANVAVTRIPATPAAPNYSLSGGGAKHYVYLNWLDVAGATSYDLEETNANDGTFIVYTGPSTTFSELTDITGDSIQYRLRACNSAGCSGWSDYRTVSL